MKTTMYGLLIILSSCTKQSKKPQTPTPPSDVTVMQDTVMVSNPELAKLKIDFGALSEIDQSGIVMSPLTTTNSGSGGRFESSYYKSMPGYSCWNIVFYNSKTREYHLLSEQKMLIQTIMDRSGLESTESKNAIDSSYILYSIVADDYNKDGLFDEKDPTYLFATDRRGKNFRQLSPANQHLSSWKYIASTRKILMNVTVDRDKNLLFDEKDPANLVEIDINNEKAINTILSDSFQLRLKILFDRDWKKKKE